MFTKTFADVLLCSLQGVYSRTEGHALYKLNKFDAKPTLTSQLRTTNDNCRAGDEQGLIH